MAVIDRDKGEVVARWQTDLAFGNFPMALDEANHRLFVGCRLPSKLVVLDTESGDVVAKSTSPAIPMIFSTTASAIASTRSAARVRSTSSSRADANTYKALTKIDTADGARTGLFVPERDSLFVAVPHRGSQQAEIRRYQIE